MKNFILLPTFVLIFFTVNAQNNVGIGTSTPDASALLHVDAGNKGMLIPRMTAVQRAAIPSPANGLMVFDTDSACVFFYNSISSAWNSLCGSGGTGAPAQAWQLAGNTGITAPTTPLGSPVNNNFIGTINAADFVIATNNSERLRITSSGNIGIGTITPTTRLTLVSSTPGAIQITDGTQNAGYVLSSDAAGVGSWKPLGINAAYGVLGPGVDVPYSSTGYIYTGTTITLPPGKFSVNVTMLMTPGITIDAPIDSYYWLRSTFSDGAAILTPTLDIIGSNLASGSLVGPGRYAIVSGSIIINNTTGAPKTYYYMAGHVDYRNTTQVMSAFGGTAWAENNIVAFQLN